MNERIEQLVGQAKFMAEETINKQISKNAELDAFAEKFAELIVRECMDVVRDINQEYDGGSTAVNAADEIAEHFGLGMSVEDKKQLIKDLLGVNK